MSKSPRIPLHNSTTENKLKYKLKLCPDGLIVDRIKGTALGFVFNDDEKNIILRISVSAQQKHLIPYLYEPNKI